MFGRWVTFGVRYIARVSWGIVFVCLAAWFYWQNHTSFSYQGEFFLVSDDELGSQFPCRVAGDEMPPDRDEKESHPRNLLSIAKKLVVERRSGLCGFGRGHSIEFSAQIPEFVDHSPFLKKLSNQLKFEYQESATEFNSVDWSFVLDQFRDPSPMMQNWSRTISLDICHQSPSAVSILEVHWEYTGGAHGNTVLSGRCFIAEKEQVRELKLEDLFTPESDWQHRLVSHCVSDLQCQGASSVSDVVVEDPDQTFFTVDDLASFTMSPAGLRFYFSPYHVGCYAEGVYTVQLPFYIVNDCIPDSSPARLFMTFKD